MAGRPSPRVVPRFVLASGSPRRRELLEKAGYEFEVVLPPVEEVSHDWLTIRELTVCNATRKAVEVAQSAPGAVVLGADTLVALDGHVIGKPADLASATKISAALERTIARGLDGGLHLPFGIGEGAKLSRRLPSGISRPDGSRHRELSRESKSAGQGGRVRRARARKRNHQANRRIVQQRRRFADGNDGARASRFWNQSQ